MVEGNGVVSGRKRITVTPVPQRRREGPERARILCCRGQHAATTHLRRAMAGAGYRMPRRVSRAAHQPTNDARMSSPPYVELHARSAFSFLRGGSLPERLAEQAAHLQYDALALTDRMGVYGAPRFRGTAKE